MSKVLALYRSLFICLLTTVLIACAFPPYQQMSEAKQALNGAKACIKNKPGSMQDQQDYQTARQYLADAESAMHKKEYTQAKYLVLASKAKSQAILKRHLPKTNIHFATDTEESQDSRYDKDSLPNQ